MYVNVATPVWMATTSEEPPEEPTKESQENYANITQAINTSHKQYNCLTKDDEDLTKLTLIHNLKRASQDSQDITEENKVGHTRIGVTFGKTVVQEIEKSVTKGSMKKKTAKKGETAIETAVKPKNTRKRMDIYRQHQQRSKL